VAYKKTLKYNEEAAKKYVEPPEYPEEVRYY